MKHLLAVLVFSALAAFGGDATGKWSGSFVMTLDGQSKDDSAYLDLKQDGTKITGTAGPNLDKQFPISSGTIDGNKIALKVEAEDAPIFFELTLDGDRLTGDAKGEHDGRKLTAKVDVKRQP